MTKCSICNHSKGKRICTVRDNSLICPVCCSNIRTADCNFCNHYKTSKEFQIQKSQKAPKEKHFIAEINPEVEAELNEAMGFAEGGDLSKADALINELYQKHPQNHQVHFGRGVINFKKKNIATAIQNFKKAVDIFPYFVEGHNNLAVAYGQVHDILNMIRSYQNVVHYGSSDPDLVKNAMKILNNFESNTFDFYKIDTKTFLSAMEIFNEGGDKMNAQLWTEAIYCFKKSIMLCENSAPVHGNLGLCYGKIGDKANALKELDRALEIDPGYEPAILNRKNIETFEDGEALAPGKVAIVNYSLDYSAKKKSLIKEVIDKFK